MRARLKGWVVCGLLLGTMAYALAEEITLTTYYPSPKGVYKALRVTDNVGIGTTTPGDQLHVQGNVGAGNGIGRFGSGSNYLRVGADGSCTTGACAWIASPVGGQPLAFWTGDASAGALAERMRIDGSGSVGIGTMGTPEMDLDIAGSSGMLLLRDSKSVTSSAIEIGMVSGNRVFFHSYSRSGGPLLPLAFAVGDTRVMDITAGGNVGIGTTTPQFARLMIEDAAVPLALRETGVAADAGGLWRMPIDGGDLRFDINTSAAGDFSTYLAPLQITKEGKVSVSRAPGGTPPQANLTVVGLCPGCILDSGVTFSNPTIEVQTPRGVGSAVGPFLRLNHRGPGGSDWWIGSAGSADDSPGDLGTLQFWLGFKGAGPPGIKMVIRQNGDVGIGTSSPSEKLEVVGNAYITGNLDCGGTCGGRGSDVAEHVPVADPTVEPGDVVALDRSGGLQMVKATHPYQELLMGVISEKPGLRLGAPEPATRPIALAGQVPVKVSLENGPIAIGDYLTSSLIPGVAMKATEPGPVIGIALQAFEGPVPEEVARGSAVVKLLCFVTHGERLVAEQVERLRAEVEGLRSEELAALRAEHAALQLAVQTLEAKLEGLLRQEAKSGRLSASQ